MKIDVVVAEIGSTTTIVNAFNLFQGDPKFLGRGVFATTVDSDVRVGLQKALLDLQENLNTSTITYDEMFATSSAAGGLRVSVHGLVYEMTVRAAKEAALGAGANIHLVTAGKLKKRELKQVQELNPNIIIIAGGTDYGESETTLHNAKQILALNLNTPVIYCGNIANHAEIKELFQEHKKEHLLKIVANVYPRVDDLNITPLRQAIYETFEEHIIHAKGMAHIKEMVNGPIMPTPGAVMEATMLLRDYIGNLLTIDVGGATTDVHSVCEPSEEYKQFMEGEPLSKRTVEGDLGVFINHRNVIQMFDSNDLINRLGCTMEDLETIMSNYKYIPKADLEYKLVYELTRKCTEVALDRHVGDLRRVFSSSGVRIIPEGKDLTMVTRILLTGGALVNLRDTKRIISDYIKKNPRKLLPNKHVKIHKDYDYIMASLGVLSKKYPDKSVQLLKKTLRIE